MARDRERGALYNVQELCTGGDLGQFLARHPPPYSPGSAAAQRAAAAYEAAWSKRNGTKAHSSDASEGYDQEVYLGLGLTLNHHCHSPVFICFPSLAFQSSQFC
jgi:hypothetical protein